jgi:hypothetical protein
MALGICEKLIGPAAQESRATQGISRLANSRMVGHLEVELPARGRNFSFPDCPSCGSKGRRRERVLRFLYLCRMCSKAQRYHR